MNYKQIETSREIRLWITGIIGPAIIGAATIFAANPQLLNEARMYVGKKIEKFKMSRIKEVK